MVMAGRSVHLTTFFSWVSLSEFTSTSCTYFACNWQQSFLNDYAVGRRITVEIISISISTIVWDWAGIDLATPGPAARLASVARQVTDSATQPSNSYMPSWFKLNDFICFTFSGQSGIVFFCWLNLILTTTAHCTLVLVAKDVSFRMIAFWALLFMFFSVKTTSHFCLHVQCSTILVHRKKARNIAPLQGRQSIYLSFSLSIFFYSGDHIWSLSEGN